MFEISRKLIMDMDVINLSLKKTKDNFFFLMKLGLNFKSLIRR